ncbi:hypothetical protein RB195_008926 [Necator americanus]|uniref:Reverse transcriptase domain-containing protein n=1 Tax=Necator americanus TaxID=51031 RepID=A0ABR1CQZ2_NECAM
MPTCLLTIRRRRTCHSRGSPVRNTTCYPVRNCTAPGPDRIRPEQKKNLPPVLINPLARLFTSYLSECKVKQWKTSKTVLLYKKEIHMTSATIAQAAYCPSSISSLQQRSLIGLKKFWMKDSHASKQGFEKDSARLTTFTLPHVLKLIEVSREYKMPLCPTFIDLEKAFDTVETEALMEVLDNQGVPTQY